MLNWDTQMKKDGSVWSDATDSEKTWYFHVEELKGRHQLIVFPNKGEGRLHESIHETHQDAKEAAEIWFSKNWVW